MTQNAEEVEGPRVQKASDRTRKFFSLLGFKSSDDE